MNSLQTIGTRQVRIRLHASLINSIETGIMKAFPAYERLQPEIWGLAGSGEIIEIGKSVTRFQPGDQVCLLRHLDESGTFAEEITLEEYCVATIPSHLDLREAGEILLPLLTAYEAINRLGVKRGESILVHQAGEGVGFQAVQIAKALGLKVIARADRRSRQQLFDCGIDEFIDAQKQSFSMILSNRPPTYIFDVNGEKELYDSLQLRPQKVVSLGYLSQEQLLATGIPFPLPYLSVLKVLMQRFEQKASANGVELMGHICSGNGGLLAKATAFAALHSFKVTLLPSIAPVEEQPWESKPVIGRILLLQN